MCEKKAAVSIYILVWALCTCQIGRMRERTGVGTGFGWLSEVW